MRDLRDDIFRDAMKRSVTTVIMADNEVFKVYSRERYIPREIY
jgi:hypothetical protein